MEKGKESDKRVVCSEDIPVCQKMQLPRFREGAPGFESHEQVGPTGPWLGIFHSLLPGHHFSERSQSMCRHFFGVSPAPSADSPLPLKNVAQKKLAGRDSAGLPEQVQQGERGGELYPGPFLETFVLKVQAAPSLLCTGSEVVVSVSGQQRGKKVWTETPSVFSILSWESWPSSKTSFRAPGNQWKSYSIFLGEKF